MENKKEIIIWGFKINLCSLKEFIIFLEKDLDNGINKIHITGVNPETVVHSKSNPILFDSLKNSDYINIDNAFIVLSLRILGYKVPERVATPDLMEEIIKISVKKKLNVFILGAKSNILENAIKNIHKDYPSLCVNGHHGYYTNEQEQEIVNKIISNNVDVLFIALPSPNKEIFINKYKNIINAKIYLGVGGAIDCRGGHIKRAPKWLQKIGLEGIHRSLQNPLYYGIRYIKFYPKFIQILLKN